MRESQGVQGPRRVLEGGPRGPRGRGGGAKGGSQRGPQGGVPGGGSQGVPDGSLGVPGGSQGSQMGPREARRGPPGPDHHRIGPMDLSDHLSDHRWIGWLDRHPIAALASQLRQHSPLGASGLLASGTLSPMDDSSRRRCRRTRRCGRGGAAGRRCTRGGRAPTRCAMQRYTAPCTTPPTRARSIIVRVTGRPSRPGPGKAPAAFRGPASLSTGPHALSSSLPARPAPYTSGINK